MGLKCMQYCQIFVEFVVCLLVFWWAGGPSFVSAVCMNTSFSFCNFYLHHLYQYPSPLSNKSELTERSIYPHPNTTPRGGGRRSRSTFQQNFYIFYCKVGIFF